MRFFHSSSTKSDVTDIQQFKGKVLLPIRYAATVEFKDSKKDLSAEGKEAECLKENQNETKQKWPFLEKAANTASSLFNYLTQHIKRKSDQSNSINTASTSAQKRSRAWPLKLKAHSRGKAANEVAAPNKQEEPKKPTELTRLTDQMNTAYEPYEQLFYAHFRRNFSVY